MTQHDFTPDALEAAGAGEVHHDPGYQWPTDPAVVESLHRWQQHKVGVIIHWGIYTAIGQGGSWSLHREHLGKFTDPPADWQGSDAEYQTWYYDQGRTFTGADLDPADWAATCRDAGMKYLVFTTKHHDGFALYDTAYSNLKSTAEWTGLQRDVFRDFTDAFRAEGLETGIYFSKADWAHPCYWDQARPIKDRWVNYDIQAEPHRWERFKQFTHDQIRELVNNYGPMNVLWLDAGWVRAPEEPIDIDEIARIAREAQPGILVVDREVPGPHENYRTPEQGLPEGGMDCPWEACITMTRSWTSLAPDDPAKPLHVILETLLKIVSGGGNYLIGIGPDATGAMPPEVRQRLGELGEWLRICGEGVYGSEKAADAPELQGDLTWYTTTRDGVLYAFGHSGEDIVPATTLRIRGDVASALLLGGGELTVTRDGEFAVVEVPESPTRAAVGIALTMAQG
ncbi:MAG: alpha-L-fucosidase [Propionibacteriaceae bacterium]|nr:alpha-L-fucosidase [Propionibacteriaceae bacterium]